MIERRHGVEAQEIESRHAQMHAVDRPVMKAGYAEGTTVAHAFAKNLPCVRYIIAIGPGNSEHVAEMPGLGLSQAKRHGALPTI